MKKLIILIIGAAICFSATAQENQVSKKRQWNKHEKADKETLIENRCKKIADKLMLDEATTAKFKDVYKAYLSELKQSSDFKKSAEQNNNELSDADIDSNVKNGFAKARKAIDVREKYYSEFRKFLTPKQARTALNMRDGNRKHKEFRKLDNNQHQQLKKRLEFNHDKQRVNDTNFQSSEKGLFRSTTDGTDDGNERNKIKDNSLYNGSGKNDEPTRTANTQTGFTTSEKGVSFSLQGRSAAGGFPKPAYNLQKSGKVVVEIYVDQNGVVTKASTTAKGSTVQDATLWKAAEDAARRARFNADKNAAPSQMGTITYIFTLN